MDICINAYDYIYIYIYIHSGSVIFLRHTDTGVVLGCVRVSHLHKATPIYIYIYTHMYVHTSSYDRHHVIIDYTILVGILIC